MPADLGYYDLRVPETRKAQADMAREYGVEGFVYWHYWFGNGKRLLERPFNEVLKSGEPDFPFALAWANESWTGTLHGLVKGKTLIEQVYLGDDDYIAHFKAVLPAFKDHRYITCDGKPIFIIYRFDKIPDLQHFMNLWRKLAIDNGLNGIYFICMGHNMDDIAVTEKYQKDMENIGFDAVVYSNLCHIEQKSLWSLICSKIRQDILHRPKRMKYNADVFYTDTCKKENAFPTVYSNWDHTPRSGEKGSYALADEYRALAAKEENVIFGGRLAEYKYYDMAPVIEHAMAAAEKELKIEILRTRVTKASMIHP